ncbi:protein S100-A7-like [Tachyglossus aculeatus]|uniref:protein S100-A7-like n=1 Tax=Tachyglossus aculeatus TaxID=9261 RepID=UPI0018F5D6BB|nr:protein S100-A7-like [Tachyglossus aculeatus]
MSCTALETALNVVVKNYHQFSRKDEDSDRLSKQEFLALLKESYPKFLEGCNRKNPEYLDKLFKSTDQNQDNAVNFIEFAGLLAVISNDYHDQFHGYARCTKKTCDDE